MGGGVIVGFELLVDVNWLTGRDLSRGDVIVGRGVGLGWGLCWRPWFEKGSLRTGDG